MTDTTAPEPTAPANNPELPEGASVSEQMLVRRDKRERILAEWTQRYGAKSEKKR